MYDIALLLHCFVLLMCFIVRNWQVIGDLATRIAKSGVNALYSFYIRNMASERVGDYVIYHYTFGVSGDLNKIRAFVKALHEATREHRMYIVRSVFLYADSDGAQNVFQERAAEAERLRLELEGLNTGTDAASGMPPEMGGPGMMPGMRGRAGRSFSGAAAGQDTGTDSRRNSEAAV